VPAHPADGPLGVAALRRQGHLPGPEGVGGESVPRHTGGVGGPVEHEADAPVRQATTEVTVPIERHAGPASSVRSGPPGHPRPAPGTWLSHSPWRTGTTAPAPLLIDLRAAMVTSSARVTVMSAMSSAGQL
jgi:hypothetical protein